MNNKGGDNNSIDSFMVHAVHTHRQGESRDGKWWGWQSGKWLVKHSTTAIIYKNLSGRCRVEGNVPEMQGGERKKINDTTLHEHSITMRNWRRNRWILAMCLYERLAIKLFHGSCWEDAEGPSKDDAMLLHEEILWILSSIFEENYRVDWRWLRWWIDFNLIQKVRFRDVASEGSLSNQVSRKLCAKTRKMCW